MNESPSAPLPMQLAQPRAPEALPDADAGRSDQEEELDKYDPSTLACTD